VTRVGDTTWFVHDRLGLMMHWGLYSVIGIEASWPLMHGDISYDEYAALAGAFNPTHFDPDAWATLAKEAGAGYVVLTTKHHDGFALWDTKFSDFSAPKSAAGRDFIGPYVEAVRKAGLKVGLYFSLPDWHEPSYPVTPTPLGTRPEKAWPPNAYHSIAEDPARWQQYLTFMNGQLRELLTNYGQIDLLWFDGGWEHTIEEWQAYDLVKMIRELQPTLIMNDRLNPSPAAVATTLDHGLSDYVQCEMALAAPDTQEPWERAISISDGWSYKPADHGYKSATTLIRYLVEGVAKNGTLLVDFGPMPDGRVQGDFVSRLRVIGDWLRQNGESIYGAGPAMAGLIYRDPVTLRGDTLYLHVFGAPADGLVEVLNLGRTVLDARILATGRPLEWEQQIDLYFGTNLRVHLPASYRDPYDTVIALTLAGE
jgi:alpha-L-fucosidase